MPKRKDTDKSGSQTKKQKTARTVTKPTSSSDENKQEFERLKLGSEWKLWGPYLSERQWGTVREDYSDDGNCWDYFPHDHAPYRAYSSGEDGLMGISDENALLCASLGLWNGKDRMMKERLFGVTGPQGNHGEDVKECYYYLDNTPTHSYMKYLYKYPQSSFPYEDLVDKSKEYKRLNEDRAISKDEYEIVDTGIFDGDDYWDVFGEYAKINEKDILCRYTVNNRGINTATIHLMPTVWFRNIWHNNTEKKPVITKISNYQALCQHQSLGSYIFEVNGADDVELIFTENETDNLKISSNNIHDKGNSEPNRKGAFTNYVIHGTEEEVLKRTNGTKCSAYYKLTVKGGECAVVKCRIAFLAKPTKKPSDVDLGEWFDNIFAQRIQEADSFYKEVIPANISEDERNVMRQAYAGMLWTKQIFIYDVQRWHSGQQQSNRKSVVRNTPWKHMQNRDVISMPDKWEFPWYATWDLAFHMIPFTHLDVEFAKKQLLLFLSDRYMHSSGQLPAYEFEFSDTNPPVHAWAVLEVFRSSEKLDLRFLKKAFMRLSLNYNWWVNQKRVRDTHLFSGGFLGMDNISCVERSNPPEGTYIAQADGTGWMAFFSGKMLQIALELVPHDEDYEDIALRFLQEYLQIAADINKEPEQGGLWDPKDEFFYDRLTEDTGTETVHHMLKIRSMVGLVPLFASTELNGNIIDKCPEVKDVLQSAIKQTDFIHYDSKHNCYLLSVLTKEKLESTTSYMEDPKEFLSDYGIRSISKQRENNPFTLSLEHTGETDGVNAVVLHSVQYAPGESNSQMFGGNSNWRGPVWICMNYLVIESLQIYGKYWDSKYGSLAKDIASRIINIFLPKNTTGRRPVHGNQTVYDKDNWKTLVLFYEYFHGDTGRGCGASHQTGWTGLVTNLIQKLSKTDK